MFSANSFVLYKGAVDKLALSLSLIALSLSGFFASSIANDSYYSTVLVINSGKPRALTMLAPILA